MSHRCHRCTCWISCFFFFSSRRRHTRLQGDWSSDVCSSDLRPFIDLGFKERAQRLGRRLRERHRLGAELGEAAPERRILHCALQHRAEPRSEERRVGEEGRSRWAPDHLKKKKKST